MKPKIVIADDSPTTQKVVKIYISKLEEDPNVSFECELVECLEESDLENCLKEHDPALVLLDFNFSDNKTGYDLASEIKSKSQAKVLMLYGTFDTVDESLFQEAGVNSYVVKPFDGAKFLTQLQNLIEESELDASSDTVLEEDSKDLVELHTPEPEPDELDPVAEDEFEVEYIDEDEVKVIASDDTVLEDTIVNEPTLDDIDTSGLHSFDQDEIKDDEVIEDVGEDEYVSDSIVSVSEEKSYPVEIDDDWVVQQPIMDDEVELKTEEVVTSEEMNSLEAGIADWGTSVPPVIGTDSIGAMELPPVIEAKSEEFVATETELSTQAEEIVQEKSDSSDKYPEEGDLAYPDEEDLEYPDEISTASNDEEDSEEEKEEEEEKPSGPMFTPMSDLADESSSEDYGYKEIGLDETSGTNTIEEVRALEQQIADEVEITSTHQLADIWGTDEVKDAESDEEIANVESESNQEPIEEAPYTNEPEAVVAQVQVSEEDIKAQVEAMLAPMVEKIVKEKVDSIVEKVSWEVLPDLAENLIRKELKEITEQVLNSDGA